MYIHGVAECLLDAIAPRRCAGCSMPCAEAICEACVALCTSLPEPGRRATPYGACHAALPFEPPVRGLVHHLKYRGRRAAAAVLGALVVERLLLRLRTGPGALAKPEIIIPVPLGRRRRRERGYNQAALLAAALARPTAAPVAAHAVRRRDTAPQVGRHGDDRRANVRGAFAWRGPPLTGRTVWLVDDVVTTGATLEALATEMQQAGASRIEGVAAAMVLAPWE